MRRVIPDMPKAKAHWVHRSSEIPDYIMVPMSDGSVIRFNPEIEQPGVLKALENIRNMKELADGGYRRKGENDESTL